MTAHDAPQGSPFPTRRELREQATAKHKSSKRISLSALTRGGLLAVLAAATVAVPVSGFVGPDNSLSLPSKAVAAPISESSWVESEDTVVTEAVGLREVASAASRAKLRTPLEISECLTVMPANGDREVTESAPIVWPMVSGTFNFASPFGMRFHPVLGYSRMHEGVDMAGPLGTPIFAPADGVVLESHPQSGSGYWIKIQHEYADGGTFYTGYAHMYASDVLVKEGDKVSAGQKIAAVGNTGTSTGPHLHFEVHDSSDTPIDPVSWLEAQNARQPGQGCE
ncbi:MAG: M23 family metallopeptidase [Actinomycetaceae bacterium]|nr:M23 family metallopeptidase [Actinomycetaceae bacterium]